MGLGRTMCVLRRMRKFLLFAFMERGFANFEIGWLRLLLLITWVSSRSEGNDVELRF